MTKTIPLTRGRVALIDDDDFEFISQWKWYCDSKGYAARYAGRKTILMHRVITNAPQGMDVDHINRISCDNRRSNLRVCTHAENMANSKTYTTNDSGYRGVYWNKLEKKWKAKIQVAGKPIHIGTFVDEKEAALAYDKVAKAMLGKFARLNFGEENTK